MDLSGGPLGLPSELRIRSSVDRDAPAMHRLTRDAYEGYVERIGREPAPMQADYSRLRPPACAWVLEHADRLVGVLVCEWAPDHLLVENVAVDSAHRGRGLGAALLGWAEQQAAAAGVGEVRLYTNAAMHENIAYYPRRGYRETHRAGEGGYRRVHFSKRVTVGGGA